jgi:hypothetical protein
MKTGMFHVLSIPSHRPISPLFPHLYQNFTSEKSKIRAGVFSRVLLTDPEVARVIGRGKNIPCCRPQVAHYRASKLGVFRQTARDLGTVSTRTQTGRFMGLSGKGRDPKKGIRGCIGLFWDMVCQAGSVQLFFSDPCFRAPSYGSPDP